LDNSNREAVGVRKQEKGNEGKGAWEKKERKDQMKKAKGKQIPGQQGGGKTKR